MAKNKDKKNYVVSYEGQIITDGVDFKTAHQIATEENFNAYKNGCYPLAEVTLAPDRK